MQQTALDLVVNLSPIVSQPLLSRSIPCFDFLKSCEAPHADPGLLYQPLGLYWLILFYAMHPLHEIKIHTLQVSIHDSCPFLTKYEHEYTH